MTVDAKKFRWDIQGLRALAVLAVVIFHIDRTLLPGGYIGVDIFFVISGYLIMGFIWRDLSSNSFSLSEFYSKRVYRLFPALFVTVAATSIAAAFILLPTEYGTFFKSLVSTLFYYSNFFFYTQADYFNDAMEYAPLLHTWSLSVEEQFYLLFPLLLIFIYKKFRPQVVWILLAVAILSLILSEATLRYDAAFSFFASPSRFFQFIAGGMIAIGVSRNRFPAILNMLLAVAGLILIVLSFVYYNKYTLFPGIHALLPTAGTALLLFAGMADNGMSRFMGNSVFKLIGNASYSIYLWHWPVIVFYKLKVSPNLSRTEEVTLLAVSLILGYLSWKFIETRTRRKRFTKSGKGLIALVFGTSMTLIVFVAGVLYTVPKLFEQSHSKAYRYLDYHADNFRVGECFLSTQYNDMKFYNKEKCIVFNADKKNYLLLGDSHAAHFYSALEAEKHSDESVSQATASGCPPVLHTRGAKGCIEMMQWVYKDLIPHKHFDTIIYSANWWYFKLEDVIKTINYMLHYTDRVVVMGINMQYKQPLPRLLVEWGDTNTSQIYKKAGYYEAMSKYDKVMQRFLKGKIGVEYISILNVECSKEKGCRTLTEEGVPVDFDDSHLTPEGARYIIKAIENKVFKRGDSGTVD